MISALWAVLAVILIVAQFATGVFDLLFVAVAALLVAAGVAVIPFFGDAIWLQVLSWVALSFGSVYVFRKRFRHVFRGEELKPELGQHAGQKAKVIEDIRPGQPGRVKFRGVSWAATAIGETIPAGAEVWILENSDAMTFLVTARLLEDETADAALTDDRPRPPEGGA